MTGAAGAALEMRLDRLRAPAADADLDAVVALEQESFTNPWSRETLVWELTHSDVTRVYLLRDAQDRAIAFCIAWVIFDELHLNTLAVSPAHRRRGLGTFMLRAVMAEAAGEGARRATLEVRESNVAALQLYGRLGFSVSARRRGYYANPPEDALILWLEEW
ncbi:MAG TPA: ribosomal protein S18-alanine N-acetyltransferase [Vicinamibacterales bacterium]